MAWFGDGLPRLSDLKGQLTNFTKEVLSEGIVEEIADDRAKALNDANERIDHLQEELNSKTAEISLLRRQNCELQKTVVELNSKPKDVNDINQDDTSDAFFWDPPSANSRNSKSQKEKVRQLQDQLVQAAVKIRDLEAELKRVREDSKATSKNEVSNVYQSSEYLRVKERLLERITEVDESQHEETDESSLIDDIRAVMSKLSSSGRQSLVKAIENDNEGDIKLSTVDLTYEKQNGPSTETSTRETELQQKVEELQDENNRLLASMEQLDQDHNEAIEKVLSLKENLESKHQTLQNAYEQLYVEYNQAIEKAIELGKEQPPQEIEKINKIEVVNEVVQTLAPETNEKDIQTEFIEENKSETKKTIDIDELITKVRNALKENIVAHDGESFFDSLIRDYNKLIEINVQLSDKMKEQEVSMEKQSSFEVEMRNKQEVLEDLQERLRYAEKCLIETTESDVDLRYKLNSSLEENIELKEKITSLEKSELEIREELRKSMDRCEYLENETQTLERSLKALQEEKNQRGKEVKDLLHNNKDYEKALVRLQQACVESYNKSREDFWSELGTTYEVRTNLMTDVRNLRERLNTADNRSIIDQRKIAELEHEVQIVKCDKHEMQEQTATKQKELDEIKGELSEAKEESKILKSEIFTICTKILQPENEACLKEIEGKDTFELAQAAIDRLDTLQNNLMHIKNEVTDSRLKDKELQILQESFTKLTEQNTHLKSLVQQLQDKTRDLEQVIESLESEKKKLDESSVNKSSVDVETQHLVASLEERTQETETLKTDNALLMKEISEMQNKLQAAIESNYESTDMAKQTIENLSNLIKKKDEEINSLKSNLDLVQTKSTEEINSFATIKNERDELVKLVTLKHNESLQYHAEIQRLTQVLNEQSTRVKELMTEQKESASVLEQKDSELYWTRNELQVLQQRLKNIEETQGSEGKCGIVEHSTQLVEISVLNEKCNALEAALIQEQSNTILLQNQLTESQNKETNAAKELERLRNHLVEMESNYTEEALIAEDMRKELESKLLQAEEKIKNSSTAYTSANVRANQQVETLQQQMALIVQQRAEIQNKLAAAEDKVLSQTASLMNLQIVLEQFQRDKERDILAATRRIQSKLDESHRKQEELMNDIVNLKEQLAEAKECLLAASRLSEQLDKKTERIEQLTQEVERLTELTSSSDQRIQQARQDEQGKVDKALIKNLLLGYLASSTTDKPSVLRVFATILDFNDAEREKSGLSHNSSNNSWFGRLSGGSLPPTKDQEASLTAAFVKFLESESKPKPQLPALPIQTTPLPKAGHSRQPSTSSTQSALLLSNVDLPTFPDFVPARNTGSILKEVLKDS